MEKIEKAQTSVSIILPVRNEANSISFVLQELERLSHTLPLEILVLDSSSVDGTAEIVYEFSKKNPNIKLYSLKPIGYGAALIEGMKRAEGDILVTFDGSGDFDATDIPKLISPLIKAEADIVLGSRFLGEIRPGSMSLLRQLGSRLMNFLVSLVFRTKITDVQTGLKAIKKETFEKLQLQALDFSISIELISKARIAGLRIREKPVTYRPRFVLYSKASIPKDLLHIFSQLIKGLSKYIKKYFFMS